MGDVLCAPKCLSTVVQLLLFISLILSIVVHGRPLIRNVRTNGEFRRLIKYHHETTGLGIIVDFYSDSCGPCRQIAPHFKKLAKKYKNQVVFAKVDVNYNRETSSSQLIRSMPTFQFYMNGKKRKQFSGADIQQLTMLAGQFSREFKENNVKITQAALEDFYKSHAPDKIDNVDKVFKKAGGKGGGKGHRSLVAALKKKYGVGPAVVSRYDPNKKKGEDDAQTNTNKSPTSNANGKPQGETNQPGTLRLHLASLEELEKELEKRQAEIEELREEAEDSGEEEQNFGGENDSAAFRIWEPDSSGAAEQVVIIGGGPAGLSAAIYAARAGLHPVVIAPPSGGQLQMKGVLVENYPAVSDITGPAVVFDMQKQAAKYGAVFLDDFVQSVTLSNDSPDRMHSLTTNTSKIETHTIIFATGADSRWLGIKGEDSFRGGGVSSCATCDGYLYSNKPVVVIGGGDTAMEEALHLAGTSSEVTVIHRGGSFSKASNILVERVIQHEKIKVLWNTTVTSFEGHNETSEEAAADPHLSAHGADFTEPDQLILSHVVLRTTQEDNSYKTFRYPCEGAFVAIGHDPNTQLLMGKVEMNSHGYIVTKSPSTETSVFGVFAAGDVADPIYRQAITSAGTGAIAALDAQRYLYSHGIHDERKTSDAAKKDCDSDSS